MSFGLAYLIAFAVSVNCEQLPCGEGTVCNAMELAGDTDLEMLQIGEKAHKVVDTMMATPAKADTMPKEGSERAKCGLGEEVASTNCLASDTLLKSQARATAKMVIGGNGYCTGWLVKSKESGSGALMLSTGHCAQPTAEFHFDYAAPCGHKILKTEYRPAELIKCNGKLVSSEKGKDEQAIYELDKTCKHVDGLTPILLDVGIPDAGEGMYLIGHPKGRPQMLSHQEPHDQGQHCMVNGTFYDIHHSQRIQYFCDTQGGNSGSPVFSARTGYAFAIHSHGGCNLYWNKANSGGLLANDGIKNALDEFGIPYVDRSHPTTGLFKYEDFVEDSECTGKSFVEDLSKNGLTYDLARCKNLCVASLTCIGIKHSASKSTCSVEYRASSWSGDTIACDEGEKHYSRSSTLTTRLAHDQSASTWVLGSPGDSCQLTCTKVKYTRLECNEDAMQAIVQGVTESKTPPPALKEITDRLGICTKAEDWYGSTRGWQAPGRFHWAGFPFDGKCILPKDDEQITCAGAKVNAERLCSCMEV